MKKYLGKLAILLVLLLALSACTPGGGDTQNKASSDSSGKKELVFGSEYVNATMDPAVEWDGWTTVGWGVGETLFKLSENLEVEPWLAESYENVDPNTWKVTLKKNVTFSDGTPLTADEVVANLKRVGEMNDRAASFKDADYNVDGNTITIKTKEPKASLINDLTDPYASIIKTQDITDDPTSVIGTGPYILESLVPDDEAVLKANKSYWDGDVAVERVKAKKILDKETASMAIKSGELDGFMGLNPQTYQKFENDENFNAQSVPSSRVYMMYYNEKNLADKNLREAIHLAIDKQALADKLLSGMMQASHGMFMDSTAYGANKLSVEDYNLDKAKKLLEDNGYTDTDGDGYLEKDGKPVELEICYYERLAIKELATEIQANLEKLGLKSKLTLAENSEYLNNGSYDLGFYCVVTTPTGDPEAYLARISQEGGAENFNHFNKDSVNGLVAEMAKTFDPAKRADLAVKIQQEILDEHYHEYLGFNKLNSVSKKEVKNFVPHPSEYYKLTKDLGLEAK